MIKLTFVKKKNIWQFGKIGVLVNFIIKELKFFKIAHFFVCQSFWPEKFEKSEMIFFTE